MKDSTKWIIGYNNWLQEKGLEFIELSELSEKERIKFYNVTNSFLKLMNNLELGFSSVGSNKFIQWMKYFFFGPNGFSDSMWEKYLIIFSGGYFSLFETYWTRKKSKFYADKIFAEAMKLYYKDYDLPKQYSLTGYQKASQEIEQMLAYPLSWPYIKRIIEYVKKNELAVWELSKIDKWKREGLFDISPEEILGRELKKDEKIIHELTLLLGRKEVKESGIVPDWVIVGEKSYSVKELIKKYGYDRYWKQRTKIGKM